MNSKWNGSILTEEEEAWLRKRFKRWVDQTRAPVEFFEDIVRGVEEFHRYFLENPS